MVRVREAREAYKKLEGFSLGSDWGVQGEMGLESLVFSLPH